MSLGSGRFHKFLSTISILTFDPSEAPAPDPEVNTIMGSAETFAGLIISQYNCDFEFHHERPCFYPFRRWVGDIDNF